MYSGLRSQDLQEAKDQLLVDTSDMLKIPLFTAEALLRNNGKGHSSLLLNINLPQNYMRAHVVFCFDHNRILIKKGSV